MVENRKNPIPWVLMGAGVLLLLLGAGWLFVKNPAAPAVTPLPASVEQVERVSLEDAKAAYDSNSAIFLDVRSTEAYKASHIPGASSIPINELTSRMGELDQALWIIPY
jgi:3-mercaptopyruvate sulfurtransferase SseA